MDAQILDPKIAYVAGLFGSAAVELSYALRESAKIDGKCPPLYKQRFYLISRVVFGFVCAAPLPIFVGTTSMVGAFYLGASALVFLDRLAQGLMLPIDSRLPRQSSLPDGKTPDEPGHR